MTTIAIPGLRRTAPKHRAIDRVAYLEHQVDGLKDLAGRQFTQITKAETHIKRQARSLRHTASHLGTSVVETIEAEARATAAEERATAAERQIADMQAELTALRARVANLDPYQGLAIGARDVTPGDEATQPIDVRALRTAHGDDYLDTTREDWRVPVTVRPLWQAPFATRPQTVTVPESMDDRTIADQFKAGERVVTLTGGPFRASA